MLQHCHPVNVRNGPAGVNIVRFTAEGRGSAMSLFLRALGQSHAPEDLNMRKVQNFTVSFEKELFMPTGPAYIRHPRQRYSSGLEDIHRSSISHRPYFQHDHAADAKEK